VATGRATAGVAWRASRPLAVALGAAGLAAGVLPIVQMVTVSRVMGDVPGIIRAGAGSAGVARLYLSLALLAVVYFTAQLAPVAQGSVARMLGARADVLVRDWVLDITVGSPGLEQVEAPEVAAAATQATQIRSATFGTDDAVRALANLGAGRLQGLLAAVVLGFFRWWAPLILLVTFLPWDAYFRAEHRKVARSWVEQTPHQARAVYFRDLATSAAAGKELRLFGLAGFVLDRFRQHFLAGMAPLWRERRTDIRRFLPQVLVVIVGYVVVSGDLGWTFATGREGVGTLSLFLLAAGQIWRLVPSFNDLSRLAIGAAPILSVRRAAAVAPPARSGSPASVGQPRGARPVSEIRFEDVSFSYPCGAPVLHGLDLTIPIGQSLAVVGENGAGKTTLIKLLCGLYQPTAGRIMVDGIDLAGQDGMAWRRHLAAVFQDFVQYPLTLRENVSFGAGGDLSEPSVHAALRDSGAADLPARWPSGLDTVLGREHSGGAELSGGQWQKVAVARALAGVHGGASVLILDEPTANLDVRAEAALFDRMLELTAGLTTILVSHRFGNVRRAGRIVVLESGRITEDGSHEELIAAGGRYAEMFGLQAARFTAAGNGS
jgi:ATP-binding cassette, subfamily B, bacterial